MCTTFLYSIAFADALKKGFLSIAVQLSPLFWVAFILRIKCLTSFLEGQLCKTFLLEEEDAFEELEDGEGSWSSYICKVASTLLFLRLLGPHLPTLSLGFLFDAQSVCFGSHFHRCRLHFHHSPAILNRNIVFSRPIPVARSRCTDLYCSYLLHLCLESV